MSVMINYDEWFTGSVYEHKERQFMNEPKAHPFITVWYFTSKKKQRGWDSSMVPLLLWSEKQPQDELH